MAVRWPRLSYAVLLASCLQGAAGSLESTLNDLGISTGGHHHRRDLPEIHVDCGGHYAETCAVCPQGHADRWCNGDCTWVWSSCRRTTGSMWITKLLQDLYDFFILLCALYVRSWWVQLLLLILMTIYAAIFKGSVVDKYPDTIIHREEDFEDFVDRDLGLFACVRNPSVLVWAVFCTPVLAAKNFEVGKSCGFWPAYAVMTTMYTPCCCIAVIMRASMANKMLRNITLQPDFCGAVFTGLCCMCCAVGREALEVDNATFVEAKCPFGVDEIYNEEGVEEVEGEEGHRSCGIYHNRGCFGGGDYNREEEEHTHLEHGGRSCDIGSGGRHGRGCCGWGGEEEGAVYHTHEEHEHYQREEKARSCGIGS